MGPSGSPPRLGTRSWQGQGTVTARGGHRSLGQLPGARAHVRGGCVSAYRGVRGAKKARPCGCHLRPLPIWPGGARAAHLSGLEGGLRGRDSCHRAPRIARGPRAPFRLPVQGRAEAGERALRRALRAGGRRRDVGPRGRAPGSRWGAGGSDRRGRGPGRDGHLCFGRRPGGPVRRSRGP